jgi:hypothetical protein
MEAPRTVCYHWLTVTLFLLTLAISAHAQLGGPPPIPPAPYSAMVFYPLESPPWADWYGDPAKGFANLNVAPSWDYQQKALSLDTNCGPYLQYYIYQDGFTNITFDAGSISLERVWKMAHSFVNVKVVLWSRTV